MTKTTKRKLTKVERKSIVEAIEATDPTPKKKGKGGRPSVMTKENCQKILNIIKMDGTIEEAAQWLGITRQTIHNHLKENPEFFDKYQRAKVNPILIAKGSIVKHMSKDGRLALQFAKAKLPNQYSERVQHDLPKRVTSITITKVDPETLKKRKQKEHGTDQGEE